MIKKIQIGVIGFGGKEEYPPGKAPNNLIYKQAEQIGFLLAKQDVVVVTGGKGGVMESAAKGARKAGGITVGVIKGGRRLSSNDYTDIEVLSGMNADGFDEFMLVMMCDALIVVGGGAGTLEEIAIAYRNKKPVVVLQNTGGWSEKIAGKYLDERELIKIELASSPEQTVKKTIKLARKYKAHHNQPL